MGYLPEFLDALFSYLSDQNPDVRTATLAVLGEFLREIKDVLMVQKEKGIWENNTKISMDKVAETSIVSEVKDTDEISAVSEIVDATSSGDPSTYFSGQGMKLLIQ